jgi:hypothetical protein
MAEELAVKFNLTVENLSSVCSSQQCILVSSREYNVFQDHRNWIYRKIWESTLLLNKFFNRNLHSKYIENHILSKKREFNLSDTSITLLELGSGTGAGGLLIAKALASKGLLTFFWLIQEFRVLL